MRRFLRKIKFRHIIYTTLIILLVYFSFALFFGFIYAPSKIEGYSMEDTIYDGDWLIIKKINIDPDQLQRGDIIIMKGEPKRFTLLWFLNDSEIAKRFMPSPIGEDWIKRIVAVGGDVVELRKDSIYVNGVRLVEPYLKDRNTTYDKHLIEYPYTVPEGEFFVMGDNRLKSHDSRNIGSIRGDEIIGISEYRIWPLSRLGRID
jgi:signal peptidase I